MIKEEQSSIIRGILQIFSPNGYVLKKVTSPRYLFKDSKFIWRYLTAGSIPNVSHNVSSSANPGITYGCMH